MIYCVSNINKRIEIERKKARLHAKEAGFFNTIEISNLEYKIKELSQKIAIDEKDFNETKENKSEEEMDE